MTNIHQETFEMVNKLTLEDVQFILEVWKHRISVYDRDERECKNIDELWINGTFIEMGVV